MSRTRQLSRLLQPFLGNGTRGYSSGAKHAARAGEEVAAISNTHRAADSVMEVSLLLLSYSTDCCHRSQQRQRKRHQ